MDRRRAERSQANRCQVGRSPPDLTCLPYPPRVIPHLFPKYIRAPNGPEASPVKQLQPSECGGWGLGHSLGTRMVVWGV